MCVDNNTSGGEKIFSCSMEYKWELLKWTVVDVHFHSKLRTSTVGAIIVVSVINFVWQLPI